MVPKDRKLDLDIIEKRTFVPTADKHNGAVVYKRKMKSFSPPEFGIRKIHFNWLYKNWDGIWVLAEHKPSPLSDLEYYPEIDLEIDQEENCPVNQKGTFRQMGRQGRAKLDQDQRMKCTTSETEDPIKSTTHGP